MNLYKLTQLDFQVPYRAEFIRTGSLVAVSFDVVFQ